MSRVRIVEDRNVNSAVVRNALIPPEFRIGTYEGKVPTYVEILGQSGDDIIHRSYFKSQLADDNENVYYCYITTKMAREPFSVKLPDDGVVSLVDPVYFANDSESTPFTMNLKIDTIQTWPPRTAYRVAKVLLF